VSLRAEVACGRRHFAHRQHWARAARVGSRRHSRAVHGGPGRDPHWSTAQTRIGSL